MKTIIRNYLFITVAFYSCGPQEQKINTNPQVSQLGKVKSGDSSNSEPDTALQTKTKIGASAETITSVKAVESAKLPTAEDSKIPAIIPPPPKAEVVVTNPKSSTVPAVVLNESIPVFIAQGTVQRTLMSCDGGLSWVYDTSTDDKLRCFSPTDCDHHPGRPQGLVFENGRFYASFGHGSPSTVLSTDDGQNWQVIMKNDAEFGGLGIINGTLFGATTPFTSGTNEGKTWTVAKADPFPGGNNSYRGAFALKSGKGRIFLNGDAPTGLIYSSDFGLSWTQASGWGTQCDTRESAVQSSNGIAILGSYNKPPCFTTDGGATWKKSKLTGPLTTATWAENRFVGVSEGSIVESLDGDNWTISKLPKPLPGSFEKITYHPTLKRFVGVTQGWNNWYENQKFFWSNDGLSWTEVAPGKVKGGHPIIDIIAGTAKPSTLCQSQSTTLK